MSSARYWILIVALLLLTAAPLSPGAAETLPEGKPQAMVERVVAEALARFIRDEERLSRSAIYGRQLIRELALPHTDTGRMARFALGPHWDDATRDQRRRFTRAFTAQMVQTYGAALHQYAAEIADFARTADIEYRLLNKRGKRATVRASVGTVPVDLLMHRHDGPWKVFDIQVAGISILLTYRASLAAQIFLSDLETVIRRLEEKTGIEAS